MRHDRDLFHLADVENMRDDRVSRFVIGTTDAFGVRHQHFRRRRPKQLLGDRREKVVLLHRVGAVAGGQARGRHHRGGNRGRRKTGRASGESREVRAGDRNLLGVELEQRLPVAERRQRKRAFAIEATFTQKRGVDVFGVVGRPENDHPLGCGETVHFGQQTH